MPINSLIIYDHLIFDVILDNLDQKDAVNLLLLKKIHNDDIFRIFCGKYEFNHQSIPLKYLEYCKKLKNIMSEEYLDKNIDRTHLITFNEHKKWRGHDTLIGIILPKYLTHLTNLKVDRHPHSELNITKLSYLTHLTLARHINGWYDCKLLLPNNLTHLILNNSYNQPLDLPPNLTHITLGDNYNQPLDLPPNLTHLTLGYYYSHPLNLPPNLTHLILGDSYDQPLDLPPNLTHLILGRWYNTLLKLPSNLIHLVLGEKYNKSLDLPLSLKYLQIFNGQESLIGDFKDRPGTTLIVNLNTDSIITGGMGDIAIGIGC